MAKDVVHSEEIGDAVIAVLTGVNTGDDEALHSGGLPANWFEDAYDGNEVALELLEHGDLADYADLGELTDRLPAIFVRALGPTPVRPGGSGGTITTNELVRVVHVRHFDHCRDADGDTQTNQARARAYYAKIIQKALFNDPHQRLATIAADTTRTEVTLTSSDTTGAQIVDVQLTNWDLGHDIGNPHSTEDVQLLRRLQLPIWAIACDIEVKIRNG